MIDRSRSIFEMVRTHAENTPDASALSSDGQSWTYSQLVDTAERLCNGLYELGATAGERVAIVTGNHPLTCPIWLASTRSGALPFMTSTLLTAAEMAGLFGRLRPAVIVVDAERRPTVVAAMTASGSSARLVVLSGSSTSSATAIGELLASDLFRGAEPDGSGPCEIALTSGTTSAPKGAVLTHEALLTRCRQENDLFEFTAADVALATTPLFHQSGLRNCALNMWFAGGHTVVTPRFSASGFWEEAVRCGATFSCFVETLILLLLHQPEGPYDRAHQIRLGMGGGPADVMQRAFDRFGLRFVQGYGMTENGFPVAVSPSLPLGDVRRLMQAMPNASLAGWPIAPTEMRLVDDAGVDVDEGPGQILIRSAANFSGYFEDAAATAAAFDDGWFATGDVGVRGPDGALYFLDRARDVIRRGGENFASKEVEAVLQQHPGVGAAVVVPVPDPVFVQEAKAFVIPTPGVDITAEELWAWCDERLAPFKVPRYVEFRDEFPTSSSGRVRKTDLRAEPAVGPATHERVRVRRSTIGGAGAPAV